MQWKNLLFRQQKIKLFILGRPTLAPPTHLAVLLIRRKLEDLSHLGLAQKHSEK